MDSDVTKGKLQELELDLAELDGLLGQATRPAVKSVLQEAATKVNNQIKRLKDQLNSAISPRSHATPVVKIINYAWDQSEQFVKLFVTLNKIQDLPADCIRTVFNSKSMELTVSGLEGKTHCLRITCLQSAIDPEKSYHKVKQDMVVIFMKKGTKTNWSSISALDQKDKDLASSSKFDDTADPSQGIMNLMKKMYDDGDDEMKRSIAKAWYEARDKQKDDILP